MLTILSIFQPIHLGFRPCTTGFLQHQYTYWIAWAAAWFVLLFTMLSNAQTHAEAEKLLNAALVSSPYGEGIQALEQNTHTTLYAPDAQILSQSHSFEVIDLHKHRIYRSLAANPDMPGNRITFKHNPKRSMMVVPNLKLNMPAPLAVAEELKQVIDFVQFQMQGFVPHTYTAAHYDGLTRYGSLIEGTQVTVENPSPAFLGERVKLIFDENQQVSAIIFNAVISSILPTALSTLTPPQSYLVLITYSDTETLPDNIPAALHLRYYRLAKTSPAKISPVLIREVNSHILRVNPPLALSLFPQTSP